MSRGVRDGPSGTQRAIGFRYGTVKRKNIGIDFTEGVADALHSGRRSSAT